MMSSIAAHHTLLRPEPEINEPLGIDAPKQRHESSRDAENGISGLEVLVAGTKDGTVLFVTPVEFGLLEEWPARDRYDAVIETAAEEGLTAIGASAMVARGYVLGYWIECDGDAWSALGS